MLVDTGERHTNTVKAFDANVTEALGQSTDAARASSDAAGIEVRRVGNGDEVFTAVSRAAALTATAGPVGSKPAVCGPVLSAQSARHSG